MCSGLHKAALVDVACRPVELVFVLVIVSHNCYVDWLGMEQAVPGVPAIQGELNPAAWMLEITTPGMEHQLGVDFAHVYKESDLARYTTQCSQAAHHFTRMLSWVHQRQMKQLSYAILVSKPGVVQPCEHGLCVVCMCICPVAYAEQLLLVDKAVVYVDLRSITALHLRLHPNGQTYLQSWISSCCLLLRVL